MPRSPTRTSTGSPGTRRIATKVTNISAMNVGIVSASRRSRYRSMGVGRRRHRRAPAEKLQRARRARARTGKRLVHVHAVELVRAERALLVAGDALAHHLVHHRVRDLHVGGIVLF